MAAKRKRTDKDAAAAMKDGSKPAAGSEDEFVDDEREPTEAVAPDGSIIKLPQVHLAPSLRSEDPMLTFFSPPPVEQKKFYRQRAHANPLADHGFD